MDDIDQLAASFARFAERECARSPLYRRLATGVAADRALLVLADQAESTPKTNLLFAAVHYLLLQGSTHPLSAFYPTVTGQEPPPGDPFPHFRAFCLANQAEIVQLLKTRRVQTNEVARSAFLFPAFCHLSRLTGSPLALVEVGTSAGLLLVWDRYHLDYGGHGHGGDPSSPVHIRCEVRGEGCPPVAERLPPIAFRAGLDLHPIDVKEPDQAAWLRALVWGDQLDRAERLRQAIAVGAPFIPPLVAGDALQVLPGILKGLSGRGLTRVVFHCHTLNQFSPEARHQFENLLAGQSREADLYQLSLEAVAGSAHPEMRLITYSQGLKTDVHLLARYDAHGQWLEWLA